MKEIKFNKQMQQTYSRYLKCETNDNLYNYYTKPSYAKIKAMEYCKKLCRDLHGYNLRIIGYNSMQFSVGFEFYNENGVLCFAYITKDYDRFCELN